MRHSNSPARTESSAVTWYMLLGAERVGARDDPSDRVDDTGAAQPIGSRVTGLPPAVINEGELGRVPDGGGAHFLDRR